MKQGQLDFADFYQARRDDCLRAVLVSTGDFTLAEDLVAEAFARAWTSWRAVSRHPTPHAWVIRTALNLQVSWWRRRRREVLSDKHYDITAARLADDRGAEAHPGSGVDAALMQALLQLPIRQREVIALRVFLDLDTQTTAQVLGIASGTVKTHLSRAAAAMREHLVTTNHREV